MHRPNEDAGIPIEIATFEKVFREFQTWLLGKCLHALHRLMRCVLLIGPLYVSVARVRTSWLDTKSNQVTTFMRLIDTDSNRFQKLLILQNEVITGCYDDVGIGFTLGNPESGISHARGSIAHVRFAQHLLRFQIRKLFKHELFIALVGNDQNIFLRANRQEAVVGHLNERAPYTEDVVKLLWKSGAAHGPKTAANATRHDDTVILVVHDFPCALECWKSEARKNRAKSKNTGL